MLDHLGFDWSRPALSLFFLIFYQLFQVNLLCWIFLQRLFSSSSFLRKVVIMEDPDQNIHLRNLSLQQSANEEEALNLLFLGDTNRMIAEVRKRETHAFTAILYEQKCMVLLPPLNSYTIHAVFLVRLVVSMQKYTGTTPRVKWHELYFLSTNALCTLKTLLKYYFGPLWPFFTTFLPNKTEHSLCNFCLCCGGSFLHSDTQTPHVDETCGGSAFALQPEVWSKGLISPCLLLLLVCK